MADPGLMAWFHRNMDDLSDGVRSAVVDTAAEGAVEARTNVATRGTAKSGKAGRIETRDMISSINFDVLAQGRFATAARFGFEGEPDYSRFQEGGFTHNRSGEWIEGMYAVTDAATEAEQKLDIRLRGLI